MPNLSEATTQTLVRYEVEGRERELVAVQVPGEPTFHVIDVLVEPLAEDGDVDARHVEERVRGIPEAEAIAADYVAVAERIGYVPMPGGWW